MVKKLLIEIIDEDEFFKKLDKKLDERDKRIYLALKVYQEPLLTAKKLGKYLDISRGKLHDLTKEGIVPVIRIGNSLRYDRKLVREALENNKINF